MPDSFPSVSDDIAFELLILHAVAERGRPLKGHRASALRASLLWEAPATGPVRRNARHGLLSLASAWVIASTLSLTPPASMPAWAQRSEVQMTVVDVKTGKPLAQVVLRDGSGNALARSGADGKLAFNLPSGEQRFTLERPGYQSVSLSRAQLGGSNLVSMRPVGTAAESSAPPTAKPTATPKTQPKATPKAQPTATPEAVPTARPKAEASPAAKPAATPRPKPIEQATPKPAQRPQAAPTQEAKRTPHAPIAPAKHYIVKRGDTLWSISSAMLGAPEKWPALYAANRHLIKRPSMIFPGQSLVLPEAVRPTGRRTHTVRRGETLWEISEKAYGTPLRWQAIYEANRGLIKRPNLIFPGQTLILPR